MTPDPLKSMFDAGPKLAVTPRVKPPWYDLSRFSPYRDLVMLIGFLMVVNGIALWTLPGALVLMGSGLIFASWLMSR